VVRGCLVGRMRGFLLGRHWFARLDAPRGCRPFRSLLAIERAVSQRGFKVGACSPGSHPRFPSACFNLVYASAEVS